jgi:hypothetical protein
MIPSSTSPTATATSSFAIFTPADILSHVLENYLLPADYVRRRSGRESGVPVAGGAPR